jgi:hypothetical protein
VARRLSLLEDSSSKPLIRLEEEDHKIMACFACKKVLDLYQCRYQTLIFKPENTSDELKRLRLKLITHWSLEEVVFLINLY